MSVGNGCRVNQGRWIFAGVTHVGGDMFKSVPDGDAIFMKVRPAFPFSFLTAIF